MRLVLRFKKAYVAVEIHPEQIRLMKFYLVNHNILVENIAFADVPANALPEELTQQLKYLVQQTVADHCRAMLAFPIRHTISKKISLPPGLTEDECEIEIKENLAQYFPGIAGELCFDFIKLPGVPTDAENVLLITTRVMERDNYCRVATQSGLITKVIDVDAYALIRLVQLQLKYTDDESIILFDLAECWLRLVIYHEKIILFYEECQLPRDNYLVKLSEEVARIKQIFPEFSQKKIIFSGCHPNLSQIVFCLNQQLNHDIVLLKFSLKVTGVSREITDIVHMHAGKLLVCFGMALARSQLC